MSFQIKSFVSIVASMVNYARTTTKLWSDYVPGSKARTILEAPALEIEELYQQMARGLIEAIPASVYLTFNFPLLPAEATTFLLRVYLSGTAAAQTISAGTVFTRSDMAATYACAVDTAVAANAASIDLLVACATPGAAGNCAPNTTFTTTSSIAGFVSAAALSGGSNGNDAETEPERFIRFTGYIQTLARGTVAAIAYILGQTRLYDAAGGVAEKVKFVLVKEPYLTDNTQPVGLVNCFIHNGVGSTSALLVSTALAAVNGYYTSSGAGVPGYKAAGVRVTVAAAPEQAVTVTGTIKVTAATDEAVATAAAQAAVTSYILGLAPEQPCEVAEIYAQVMAVPGVTNWLPVVPTTASGDIVPPATTKLMPGAITVVPG